MRVLILEDTAARQQILRQLFRDHAWVLVHTGARAIRLLEAFEFDVVSLDYDIAGDLCGADVAARIVCLTYRPRVVVHSMNPQGRTRIRALLPDALVLPVASMTTTNQRFKRLRDELLAGKDFDWSFATRTNERGDV